MMLEVIAVIAATFASVVGAGALGGGLMWLATDKPTRDAIIADFKKR